MGKNTSLLYVFALVIFNLKHQTCAKVSLSLLLVLLEPDQGLIRNICPNEAGSFLGSSEEILLLVRRYFEQPN